MLLHARTRRQRKVACLESDFLVVSVLGVLLVDHKRPPALAVGARCRLDVCHRVPALHEGPNLCAARAAGVVKDCHLWIDARAARDDPRNLHESIQVRMPEYARNCQVYTNPDTPRILQYGLGQAVWHS